MGPLHSDRVVWRGDQAAERELAPTPARLVLALLRLARPAIWPVSLVPLWTGYVLASRDLVPPSVDGALEALVAIIVMGPLVWASALAINDLADLPADRLNPRKAGAPLVRGVLTPSCARRAAYGFGALALFGASWLGAGFTLTTAAFLALGCAYSVPPVRLKNRPGADLMANALGVGVIPMLAGWSLVRPMGAFPHWFVVQGLLVAVALYVPSTLVDFDADRAFGGQTLATVLGFRRAYLVGWGAWLAANGGMLVMSAADYVVPRSILPVLVGCTAGLVAEYHWLIGRARTSAAMVRGIVALSVTFLVPSAVFGLAYTGHWTPV
jgi:lycopene elongase/hydratase (dihydrobisanhydrobacterioruberin-forming)